MTKQLNKIAHHMTEAKMAKGLYRGERGTKPERKAYARAVRHAYRQADLEVA